MLVKVGKLKKGAEKADDLQSVARTTDPTVLKGRYKYVSGDTEEDIGVLHFPQKESDI